MFPFLLVSVFAQGIQFLDLKPGAAAELRRRSDAARRLGNDVDALMSDATAKHLATLKKGIEVEERTLRKLEELANDKKYSQLIPGVRKRIAEFKQEVEKIENERR